MDGCERTGFAELTHIIGVSATSSGPVITTAANNTVYGGSVSSGATATVSFRDYAFGTTPATIGGKATSGDTLTLTTVVS